MPIIDDVTTNLGLPLPNADNFLADDVTRLRTSLTMLDTVVASKANAASTNTALSNKADLVSGKVPAAQLPAYVDDVIEVANLASMPTTGETGKIYVTLDTNKQYRWSGSTYIEISKSPGTTDDVAEGATNKYFTGSRALAAIPNADAATFGLVKIGAGLGLDSNGALFASAGAGSFMQILEITPPANNSTSVTVPGGYVVGGILVGVDGTLLPPSDYTATNGTSIGLVGFTVGLANTVLVVKLSSITLGSLPAGSVTDAQIADGAVTSAKIATNAVTATKILDGNVAFNKLDNEAKSFGPAIAEKTSAYTLATTDVGRMIVVGAGGSIVVNNSIFAANNAVSLFNNTAGNVTITLNINTAYMAGIDVDRGSLTLAPRGVATIVFIGSTVCVISGTVS